MERLILPAVSLLIGFLASISFICVWLHIDGVENYVFLGLSFLLSLIGIIYSLIIRRKSLIIIWIAGFLLNLIVLLLNLLLVGFLVLILVLLGSALAPFA